jgi:hypothetical protein
VEQGGSRTRRVSNEEDRSGARGVAPRPAAACAWHATDGVGGGWEPRGSSLAAAPELLRSWGGSSRWCGHRRCGREEEASTHGGASLPDMLAGRARLLAKGPPRARRSAAARVPPSGSRGASKQRRGHAIRRARRRRGVLPRVADRRPRRGDETRLERGSD